VVVSAAAPIGAAIEEFARAEPGQSKALAAEMSLVGVPSTLRLVRAYSSGSTYRQ
jgi:hypothetical protein